MVTSEIYLLPGFGEIFRADDTKRSKEESERLYRDRLQASLDAFGGAENANLDACIALWAAVLMRQIKDAIGLDLLICNVGEEKEEPKEVQRLGIEYFLNNSNGFKTVCEFANVNSDRVRTKMILELHKRNLIYSDGYKWHVHYDNLVTADNDMPMAMAA